MMRPTSAATRVHPAPALMAALPFTKAARSRYPGYQDCTAGTLRVSPDLTFNGSRRLSSNFNPVGADYRTEQPCCSHWVGRDQVDADAMPRWVYGGPGEVRNPHNLAARGRTLILGLMALCLVISCGVSRAAEDVDQLESAASETFKVLRYQGNLVRWQRPFEGGSAEITYRVLTGPQAFANAHNCRGMTALDGLLAASEGHARDGRHEARLMALLLLKGTRRGNAQQGTTFRPMDFVRRSAKVEIWSRTERDTIRTTPEGADPAERSCRFAGVAHSSRVAGRRLRDRGHACQAGRRPAVRRPDPLARLDLAPKRDLRKPQANSPPGLE